MWIGARVSGLIIAIQPVLLCGICRNREPELARVL